MRIKFNTNILNLFFLSLLFSSSFYFGYKYSFFNADIHHYSVILETYLDKINGYKLNKDIFVIYGNGQIYLYQFLSYFMEIDLVNIGIITQFFFSIKFFLFFFISKYFVNNFFSLIGTLIYYFLYTFSQTVSGDVYASFFLHLFLVVYLYNSEKQNNFLILFSSFILFLVIFFRHTYILNFISLIPIIIVFNFFLKNKFSYEIKILIYFSIFLSIFFVYLFNQDILFIWFDQFLGIGLTDFLNIRFGHGSDIFTEIYKVIYYILRIIRHIIFPNSFGSNYFFSIIILFNFYFLISFIERNILRKNISLKKIDKYLFFLCILGICGTVQLMNKFETSRYLNASFSFIIVFIYIFAEFYKNNKYKLNKNIYLFLVFILFTPILLKYPFSSNFYNFKLDKINNETKFNFNNNYFIKSNQKFFGKKRFNKEFTKFYVDIKNEICNYEYIYNISFDRSFQYICDDKKKYISTLSFKMQNRQFDISHYKKNENQNKILISNDLHEELNLIKIFQVPKFYSYTQSDIFFTFFPDKIYVYQ